MIRRSSKTSSRVSSPEPKDEEPLLEEQSTPTRSAKEQSTPTRSAKEQSTPTRSAKVSPRTRAQQLDAPVIASVDSEPSTDNGEATKKEEELKVLKTHLRREALKAKFIIREKAEKYAEQQTKSEVDAASLKLVPFDPKRLLTMPFPGRESLALMLARILFIYASETVSEIATIEYRQAFSEWSTEFLTHVLKLLKMEKSPAMSVMIEDLNKFQTAIMPKTRRLFKRADQNTDSLQFSEDYLNAQPTKTNLLHQCDLAHKAKISASFNAAVKDLTDKLRSSAGQNGSQAPKNGSQRNEDGKKGGRDTDDDLQSSEAALDRLTTLTVLSVVNSSATNFKVTGGSGASAIADLKAPSIISVVLRDLLLMLIFTEKFDARVYEIFKRTSEVLDVRPYTIMIVVQDCIANDLVGDMMKGAKEETWKKKQFRRLKIAGVAVGIGAAAALTAGLAAPAMVSGFAALGLAGTSSATAFFATVGGSATIASVFGAGTAGISGWKFSKRIGRIKVFSFDKVELPETSDSSHEYNSSSFTYSAEGLTSLSDGDFPEEPHHHPGSWDAKERTSSDASSICHSAECPASIDSRPLIPNKLEQGEQKASRRLDMRTRHQYAERKPSESPDREIPHQSSKIAEISNREAAAAQSSSQVSLNSNGNSIHPPSLTVTICISGWLRSMRDICGPWTNLATIATTDVFALRWDPDILLEFGVYLVKFLSQKIAVSGAQFWLQHTVMGALSAALTWPVTVIQFAAGLDNTWMAAKERAKQAGKLLAEALCDKSTGTRPVTLIGYSMGAKVIIRCLLELHQRKAFHLVSDVIVMGTPETADRTKWRKIREVVSGRVVNVYSHHDWILAFLYRYMEWGVSVSGLAAIDVDGVESYDLKALVKSHAHYAEKIDDILAYVSFFALPRQQLLSLPPTKQ